MIQSKKDLKEQERKDRITYGSWYPQTKNKFIKYFEKIGKPIAFSIRAFPFMRTRLGGRSYQYEILLGGFIWFRLWIIGLDGFENQDAIIRMFFSNSYYASFLSFASYVYLCLGFYYKSSDRINFSFLGKDVKSYDRGKSLLFDFNFPEDSDWGRDFFQFTTFEPVLIFLIGCVLSLTSSSPMLGYFFMCSSAFYAFDELIYHLATDNQLGNQRGGIDKGKKIIKVHEKMNLTIEDDSDAYF